MKYATGDTEMGTLSERLDEIRNILAQNDKDSALPTLLFVSRKLGELDVLTSQRTDSDDTLINIQKDFHNLYEKLQKRAGIDMCSSSTNMNIGGDE